MEILEIGGQLYVPPEEFARVDIPRLLEVIDPQHIAELPVAGIGRDTGVNSEEGRQVSTRDESPRMAQRRAGSAIGRRKRRKPR